MRRTFVRLPAFEKAWSAMGLTEDDYIELENELLKNPKAGDVIKGSGGIRKLRFSFPGRGKSGSGRAIYIDILVADTIYMIYAYPKSAIDDLTKSEISALKKLAEQLKKEV